MSLFPTHTIFRQFKYYDISFKNIFDVDPHAYSVRLSSYYYDRYRAVSMSSLGIPDSVLDNDLYGYSPYFYFGDCGLQSLFPITFILNPRSYIKTRLVLPVKFYRNYFSFINIYTRLQFQNAFFFLALFREFIALIPNVSFSRFIVHSAGIIKGPQRRKKYETEKDYLHTLQNFRLYTSIYFKFKVRKIYVFRFFANTYVSLPIKAKFRFNWQNSFFSRAKNFANKSNFLEFNFTFCLTQLLVPNLQRFIKMLLKFESKIPRLEFDKFYQSASEPFFSNFFQFLRKFMKNFARRTETMVSFLRVSNAYTTQVPFLYTQALTLRAFFFSFVFVFFRLKSKVFDFSRTNYQSVISSFALRILTYSKLKIFVGNFYYSWFSFIIKPVRIFRLPLNLKSNFFSQLYDFRYIYYGTVAPYLFYGDVTTNDSSFKFRLGNNNVIISNYKFYFNKIIRLTNLFPHRIRVFGFRISNFFDEVQSLDKFFIGRFNRSYFTNPLDTDLYLDKNLLFRFSRSYVLRASVYRVRKKIRIFNLKTARKQQPTFRRGKTVRFFSFLK